MTTFDRREEAFESMFAHDEEMHFKAEVRRSRHLAAWAAGLMGRSDSDTAAYVDDIARFGVEHGGAPALFTRIRDDLAASGASVTDSEIHAKMDEYIAEAVAYLKTA